MCQPFVKEIFKFNLLKYLLRVSYGADLLQLVSVIFETQRSSISTLMLGVMLEHVPLWFAMILPHHCSGSAEVLSRIPHLLVLISCYLQLHGPLGDVLYQLPHFHL